MLFLGSFLTNFLKKEILSRLKGLGKENTDELMKPVGFDVMSQFDKIKRIAFLSASWRMISSRETWSR